MNFAYTNIQSKIPLMRIDLPCLLKLAFLLLPTLCLAHGEMKPGPHGGEIRMPGAFHVEVVPGSMTIEIYLLDMQFKNPQIEDSLINVILHREAKQMTLECQAISNKKMFRCLLPDDEALDAGRLMVNATRGGPPSEPMHYELPLKWSGALPVTE